GLYETMDSLAAKSRLNRNSFTQEKREDVSVFL
ncbi:AGAP007986-PA, partial [Anopheles gambiae str. PEST]